MIKSWKNLDTVDKIDVIIENSKHKPQIIFKHSKTCGISQSAYDKLESGFALLEGKVDFHYLDLLSYRSVSDEVAEKTGVLHQSPQIILLENGKVVYTVTHLAISPEKIVEHLV